jgi:hypothetical protein
MLIDTDLIIKASQTQKVTPCEVATMPAGAFYGQEGGRRLRRGGRAMVSRHIRAVRPLRLSQARATSPTSQGRMKSTGFLLS